MKIILLTLISLLPVSSQAGDQDRLNSIYQNVGHEVLETLSFEDRSKNELSLWTTEADRQGAIEQCSRKSCIQTFQKMALQLNSVTQSTSWTYLNRLSSLSVIAKKALNQLDLLETSMQNEPCNLKLRDKLESISNAEFLNSEKLSDESASMEMKTEDALRFLKIVTRNGRNFSQYLNLDQPEKDTLINRGKEIHLAVRVIKMTIANQPTSDEMRWAAEELIEGCSAQ